MFAVVILIALLFWGVRFALDLLQVPSNAYAMWDGACLMIDHLRVNHNQWPRNWDDLKATLARGNGMTRFGFTIQDLQRRIIIDFDADPNDLAKSKVHDGRPDFRVIRLRSGKDTHWERAEPNTLIYQYLTNPAHLLQSSNYHPTIPIP